MKLIAILQLIAITSRLEFDRWHE